VVVIVGGHVATIGNNNYAIIVIGKRGALFLVIISFSTMKKETGKGGIIMCKLFSYSSSSCAYQKEE